MSQARRDQARNLGKVQPEPSKPMSAGALLSALDMTDHAVERGLVKRFSHFAENGAVMVWGERMSEDAWESFAAREMQGAEERNLEMLSELGLHQEKSQAEPTNRRGRRRRPTVERGEIPSYTTGESSAEPKPSPAVSARGIIRV